MTDQKSKAAAFRALHVPGSPLVLFNIWDPGSARAVEAAGAVALATGSWSVANANGFADGEHLPLDLVLSNLARIVAATGLPVSIDLESGYGETPAAVAQTVVRAIEAGAIGCNIEDSYPADGSLRPIAEQRDRISQAYRAAEAAGVAFFINARTDIFFQSPSAEHDDTMVADALERARVYADAGASGVFAPGLIDERLIGQLTRDSPLPLNVMVTDGTPPLAKLAELGVARVSHGPGPFVASIKAIEKGARAAMGKSAIGV